MNIPTLKWFTIVGMLIAAHAGVLFAQQTPPKPRETPRVERSAASPEGKFAASAEGAKAALTAVMLRRKYKMDSQAVSQIVFSRELSGRELAPLIMMGKPPAKTPRRIVKFSLAERAGETTATAEMSLPGISPEMQQSAATQEADGFKSEVREVFESVNADLARAQKSAPREAKDEPFIPPMNVGSDGF